MENQMAFPGSLHCHSDYSNLRGRDAINTVDRLADYAIELGHTTLAITEHECLSNHIKIEKVQERVGDKLKIIKGNEIYLCRNGLNAENFDPKNDKYYHFILLACDPTGHKQLREISTRAWNRSYMARGMRRVPTYYQDLVDIIEPNQGHVIGSTACLGSCIDVQLIKYRDTNDDSIYDGIIQWCKRMIKLFGKGYFYLELQPSENKDQIYVNKELLKISKLLDIPYIITNDAHYLKEDEAFIHEAFLKSQNVEREVASFYKRTYLMNTQEVESYLDYMTRDELNAAYQSIQDISNKCEIYSLKKPLKIPYLPWKESSIKQIPQKYIDKIPNLKKFKDSAEKADNLMAKKIVEKLEQDERLRNQEIYNEIEYELEMILESSEVNKASWSAYLLNLQKIVDCVWNAGSLLGCGRGSGAGFLLLYLLEIIQINPLWEDVKCYPWRFLNPSRVSVLDVDCDISGLKREQVLDNFRKVYGQDRVSNVATFGTEKSKSAILTAARGLGIDVDLSQYIASLVPSDRGAIRSLDECYYGDKEKDFKPITEFKKEMDRNPDLWQVAHRIEGLVCRTGIHAGGLVFVDEPFTESCSLMTAPDGTVITSYELHDLEDVSLIKYDLLSVEYLDRIQTCLELLVEEGCIEDKGNLKDTYESAIGIYNLERDNPNMWKMVQDGKISKLFQMTQQSGIEGIRLTHPKNLADLTYLNAVIRLMAPDKDSERPLEKYARFGNNPNLFEDEMNRFHLTKEEKELLRKHLSTSRGLCLSQEQIMSLVQEPELGGFDLGWADALRKSIAKKKLSEYEHVQEEFFENAKEKSLDMNFCQYVWKEQISLSRSYSFNVAHGLSYALAALQEMNLAFKYPTIIWDTANLIVDAGGRENLGKMANYGKISVAINKMIHDNGTNISLLNINESGFTFAPDVENNAVKFGFSAASGVGSNNAIKIIEGQPYSSFEDFIERCDVNRTCILALINGGAFDKFEPRERVLEKYLRKIANPKKRITMQNYKMLMERGLIPELKEESRLFVYDKALKKFCKRDDYYIMISDNFLKFFEEKFDIDLLESCEDETELGIKVANWKKLYDKGMLSAKKFIKENSQRLLVELNESLYQEEYEKYAPQSRSQGEMIVLGFYKEPHELEKINYAKEGLINYDYLGEEPEVDYTFRKNGREIPILHLERICGTVLNKDAMHSMFTILTPEGNVVDVKTNKDFFARVDKQISESQSDGTKKVMEKSWLKHGTLVMLQGIRKGSTFLLKKYNKSLYHQFYKIDPITFKNTWYRYGEEPEEF